MMLTSNAILHSLGQKLVKLTRTITVQGPADKVHRQLNTDAAYLREDTKFLPDLTLSEAPRVVEVYNDMLGDFEPFPGVGKAALK